MPSGGWYLDGSGDVDGDGDVDLITSSSSQFSPRIEINLLRQLDAPYPAQLAQHYALAVYARFGRATNGDLAYPLLAPATAHLPLPPFGTLFLQPSTMVPLPPLAIPQPAGTSSLAFVVPNIPGLVGAPIYARALLVQNPAGYLTNLTADEIIR